jgi:hypothetical protein
VKDVGELYVLYVLGVLTSTLTPLSTAAVKVIVVPEML